MWTLLVIVLLSLFYWILIKPHRYWVNKGVQQGKQTYFFGDSLKHTFGQQSFADLVEYVYKKIPNVRYSGMYQLQNPILVIRDPKLIKQITVKDFDHFTDHQTLIHNDWEPLCTRNLFALKGKKWGDMRSTISSTFTTSKIKSMFSLMSDCSEQFANYCSTNKDNCIELKDVFTRFTNDVIATCAFGVTCDSLKYKNNVFYLMGKKATETNGFWADIKILLMILAPKFSKLIGLRMIASSISQFFTTLVSNTVNLREEQNIVRPDMINLLIETRKYNLSYNEQFKLSKETIFATVKETDIGNPEKQEITDADMAAQAMIFFLSGFDTVSSLMYFMAYELAVNPAIQQRLHNEIDTTIKKSGGEITYEIINKMNYLDMIISETLRKWPAGVLTDRECTKPYTIKAKYLGESDVYLNKGDIIWIPVFGIHRNPNYFPDPDKFDPERFSEENKSKIKPFTYIPFGAGPRMCIGSKFAILETKTVFVHLLLKMELIVDKKTEIPLRLSKTGFTMNPENGIWVGMKPRVNSCEK